MRACRELTGWWSLTLVVTIRQPQEPSYTSNSALSVSELVPWLSRLGRPIRQPLPVMVTGQDWSWITLRSILLRLMATSRMILFAWALSRLSHFLHHPLVQETHWYSTL